MKLTRGDGKTAGMRREWSAHQESMHMAKKDEDGFSCWKGAAELVERFQRESLLGLQKGNPCTCARKFDDNLWIQLGLQIAAAIQYEGDFKRAEELARQRDAYERGVFVGMDATDKPT